MSRPLLNTLRPWILAIFAYLTLPGISFAAPAPVTVFAATSLTDVMQQIGDAYTRKTGQPVVFSFAGTATLARQIAAGARADVFISADERWMDEMVANDLVVAATRRDLFGTRLVLIAPTNSKISLRIEQNFPLARALGVSGRLSIADPQSVPAGRYARAALESLGVWSSIANHLVLSDNVRTALNFVARGESALGIVYETDARLEARVKVLGIFPATSYPPIRYSAAQVRSGIASGFLNFLATAEARSIATRAGFLPAQP